jgi:ZIP family zinc transporter
MNGDIVWLGTVASLVAGLATGFGALPVLFTKRVSDKLLDIMLGFAAGAMFFVIADEMIPESHKKGFQREATFGLIAAFVIMMLLDTIFS